MINDLNFTWRGLLVFHACDVHDKLAGDTSRECLEILKRGKMLGRTVAPIYSSV